MGQYIIPFVFWLAAFSLGSSDAPNLFPILGTGVVLSTVSLVVGYTLYRWGL